MLTCIACSKQISRPLEDYSEEDDLAEEPTSRLAIRALTSQMRDMAVKATGVYRQCKPCNSYAEAERWSDSCRDTSLLSDRIEDLAQEQCREWVAQVEPGVLITLFSLPYGKNDLRRIRFSREMFDRVQAQRWWAENCDKIMELYNIHRLHPRSVPLSTPPRSEDEMSQAESAMEKPVTPSIFENRLQKFAGTARSSSPDECSARTSESAEESEEREWVEQDEPGVYITIRATAGGGRELRRVRFSRERFNEMHARMWWEENRSRVHKQYL